MSSIAEDMCAISVELALTAAIPDPGRMATARAIKKIRMVRPAFMGSRFGWKQPSCLSQQNMQAA